MTWGLSEHRAKQVNELKNEIYTPLPLGPGHAGDACVRLLHASGTVGCAAPTGAQPTEGRLVRLETLRQPDEYPGALAPPQAPADDGTVTAACRCRCTSRALRHSQHSLPSRRLRLYTPPLPLLQTMPSTCCRLPCWPTFCCSAGTAPPWRAGCAACSASRAQRRTTARARPPRWPTLRCMPSAATLGTLQVCLVVGGGGLCVRAGGGGARGGREHRLGQARLGCCVQAAARALLQRACETQPCRTGAPTRLPRDAAPCAPCRQGVERPGPALPRLPAG